MSLVDYTPKIIIHRRPSDQKFLGLREDLTNIQ